MINEQQTQDDILKNASIFKNKEEYYQHSLDQIAITVAAEIKELGMDFFEDQDVKQFVNNMIFFLHVLFNKNEHQVDDDLAKAILAVDMKMFAELDDIKHKGYIN